MLSGRRSATRQGTRKRGGRDSSLRRKRWSDPDEPRTSHDPRGRPRVTPADFQGYALSDEPALLLDLERGRVRWANDAACALWHLDADALARGDAPWPQSQVLGAWRALHDRAAGGGDGSAVAGPGDATCPPMPGGAPIACKLRLVSLPGDAPGVFLRAAPAPFAAHAEELARLGDFVNAGSDWVWETDADGRFTYVSPGIHSITGRDPKQMIGRTREDLARRGGRPEALAQLRPIADAMAARKPFSKLMMSFTHRDGSLRHVLISGIPVFDAGRFQGYRGSGRDISDLAEAQRRQAVSEQRFRDFAESASDWFWELDRELRFSFVSPGVAQRTGEEADHLIGRVPVREGLENVSDEAWAAHVDDLRAHRPIVDFRFARTDRTGRLRHFSVSAKPIFDAEGGFAGYRGTGRDITELVEARRFLRDVIDAVPAIIAVRDLDGRYLLANKAYAALCGTEPEKMVGKIAGSFLGMDRGRAVLAEDREAIARGSLPPRETTLRSLADGQDHAWLNQKVPLRDAAGRVTSILSLGTDITTFKKAEAALLAAQAKLRESEQRFRDFTESASTWVWEQDEQLRFTLISAGFAPLSDIPIANHYGLTRRQSGSIGVSDDDWARHEADQAARRPFSDFRFGRIDPQGRYRHLSISGKPVFDDQGRFKGYRGTGRDMTALFEAEARVKANEQRFRDFAEAASHWVWETDAEDRVVMMSEGFERLTGVPVATVLGKRASEPIAEDPGRSAAGVKATRMLADRKPFMDVRIPRRLNDGRLVHLAISGKPIFDERGTFKGYRGVTRDVTPLVEAEAETQRLRHARDIAAAADMAKSRFLANLSHELRTPLNAILGLSEIMGGEMFGPIGVPAYRDYAHDIHSSGRHLLAIINDLLDKSRIELGQFQLSTEPVDANELAEEALRIVRGALKGEGPTLALKPCSSHPVAAVDRRAMRQVLINLLSNASKFTEADGRIDLAVEQRDGGGLAFVVTDTGCGIEPSRLAHIFEPFQHAHAHQARKGQGAGLGLWLSRSLVELHGGRLELQSEPGKGTRATVTLPPTLAAVA